MITRTHEMLKGTHEMIKWTHKSVKGHFIISDSTISKFPNFQWDDEKYHDIVKLHVILS